MTTEEKLKEIYCKWMHFDSKDGKPYIYWDEKSIDSALKEAYNLAIEDAINSAEAELVIEDDPVVGEYQDAVVNYESIIKLKI